jgi:hypothetical protein
MEHYRTLSEKYEALLDPIQMFGLSTRTNGFREYARLTYGLFAAIRRTTSCQFVVDSSKSPARALALSRTPGLRLSLLHLLRDGRGVAWSMMKTHKVDLSAGVQRPVGGAPALRTAHRWIAFNLLTEFAVSTNGTERSVRLRYEDFTADPLAALEPALAMLGYHAKSTDVTDLKELIPGHQVAGSRVRMQKSLSISRDDSWVRQMPERDRKSVERRAGWMLRRYGYV